MFTGIIEEIGTLSRIERGASFCHLTIQASRVLEDCKDGDSIAVNGICLTVTRHSANSFVVDAMAETVRRTNLGNLKSGDRVNLERSLRVIDRMGGHIVAGHVDGVGTIAGLRTEDIATIMTVSLSPALTKYIAVKGSVCIDGVSLTVTEVSNSSFQVSLIPYSKENSTLGLKRAGDSVNIEVDMLARYLERLISYSEDNSAGGNIDQDFLRKHGFL